MNCPVCDHRISKINLTKRSLNMYCLPLLYFMNLKQFDGLWMHILVITSYRWVLEPTLRIMSYLPRKSGHALNFCTGHFNLLVWPTLSVQLTKQVHKDIYLHVLSVINWVRWMQVPSTRMHFHNRIFRSKKWRKNFGKKALYTSKSQTRANLGVTLERKVLLISR
jgi:hypothetical protein